MVRNKARGVMGAKLYGARYKGFSRITNYEKDMRTRKKTRTPIRKLLS